GWWARETPWPTDGQGSGWPWNRTASGGTPSPREGIERNSLKHMEDGTFLCAIPIELDTVPTEGTRTEGRSIRFGADVGSAAPGSTTRAQRRGKDFPFRGSQVLGYRCARNSDQACNLSQRRFGGTRVVAKMIRELEEIPLSLRQGSQRLPGLKGRVLHRPDPVRRLHIIEESAQGGKDLLGGQEDHAGLAGADRGDLEGHCTGPLLAQEASKSLGQTPLDPRDIFSPSPVGREDLEAGHAVSTRDRAGLPPDGRLVFERALPMHTDDEGVRLRAHGKGLKDLDGAVVTKEAVAQDLEVVEERRRHRELEALHRRMVDR